jgi:hypothetical protein
LAPLSFEPLLLLYHIVGHPVLPAEEQPIAVLELWLALNNVYDDQSPSGSVTQNEGVVDPRIY